MVTYFEMVLFLPVLLLAFFSCVSSVEKKESINSKDAESREFLFSRNPYGNLLGHSLSPIFPQGSFSQISNPLISPIPGVASGLTSPLLGRLGSPNGFSNPLLGGLGGGYSPFQNSLHGNYNSSPGIHSFSGNNAGIFPPLHNAFSPLLGNIHRTGLESPLLNHPHQLRAIQQLQNIQRLGFPPHGNLLPKGPGLHQRLPNDPVMDLMILQYIMDKDGFRNHLGSSKGAARKRPFRSKEDDHLFYHRRSDHGVHSSKRSLYTDSNENHANSLGSPVNQNSKYLPIILDPQFTYEVVNDPSAKI